MTPADIDMIKAKAYRQGRRDERAVVLRMMRRAKFTLCNEMHAAIDAGHYGVLAERAGAVAIVIDFIFNRPKKKK